MDASELRQIGGESMVLTYAPRRENATTGRITREPAINYRAPTEATEATEGRGRGDSVAGRDAHGHGRTAGRGDGGTGQRMPSAPHRKPILTYQRTDPHPTRLHPHLRLARAGDPEKYPMSKIF